MCAGIFWERENKKNFSSFLTCWYTLLSCKLIHTNAHNGLHGNGTDMSRELRRGSGGIKIEEEKRSFGIRRRYNNYGKKEGGI